MLMPGTEPNTLTGPTTSRGSKPGNSSTPTVTFLVGEGVGGVSAAMCCAVGETEEGVWSASVLGGGRGLACVFVWAAGVT